MDKKRHKGKFVADKAENLVLVEGIREVAEDIRVRLDTAHQDCLYTEEPAEDPADFRATAEIVSGLLLY